ncbi:serine-threonine protein kinase 19-domain-containing protein [Microdochium bolleyi]|uniref:Serine-threonine protein kinase 19-domain-containing protein n=1 Tax=Microdochium bolleyi TaxID=196109 RepID=A0A136JEE0_9PEZI|nr:serine-threonine protein kinase 19-domain-containing protein [Microdochium bolleyi]
MSLRKILGGSGRVKKPAAKRAPSTSASSQSSSSSWTTSLTRTKPAAKRNDKTAVSKTGDHDDGAFDLFDDKLDDYGLVQALASDLNLRDTSQAIHYIRAHMFSPLPEQATGMGSVRISEVLNYRKNLPRIVTVSHIQVLLTSPSAVEREIAELVRSGFLYRIVVARRGDIGDTLLLASEFADLIQGTAALAEDTKSRFLAYLKQNPGSQTVQPGSDLLAADIDQLIKSGFLTSHHSGATNFSSLSSTMNLYSRPEDRGTLTSLEVISRQAAGSLGAVGGQGAVYMAGGSAGGASHHRDRSTTTASATDLKLAVPGNGTFLKLVSAALEHLVSLLTKANKFRELPESVLRDRWDGGISKDEARYAAKRSRREFAGILPGQTRKWRQFSGLAFDWVLQEAVGSGLVEVFETGSVGRGIRACPGR